MLAPLFCQLLDLGPKQSHEWLSWVCASLQLCGFCAPLASDNLACGIRPNSAEKPEFPALATFWEDLCVFGFSDCRRFSSYRISNPAGGRVPRELSLLSTLPLSFWAWWNLSPICPSALILGRAAALLYNKACNLDGFLSAFRPALIFDSSVAEHNVMSYSKKAERLLLWLVFLGILID